jgi:uncharacterized protein YbjT (DUF2867 family)
MPTKIKVLVTGATGKQGGAVARLLLEHGHTVRALTRTPESPPAKALAEKGAELVKGDTTDRASLDSAARGVDAVFSVSTPFGAGPPSETKQGVTVADAAKAAGAFLLYTSVANADKKTGIPHFDSKFEVEKHIRASGAEATIIAPVYFMENLFFGRDQLKKGVYGSPVSPGLKLAQIAVENIGAVAVAVLEDKARHAGKRYDIAGDELSGEDCVRVLSAVAGRPFQYFQVPLDVIRKGRGGDDSARMYAWFESTGYSFDRGMLAREFPAVKWTSFEEWAKHLPKDLLSA